MQRSAHRHHVPLARLSFKGTLDPLRHWSPLTAAVRLTPRKQEQLTEQMLAFLAADLVPERPGRSETGDLPRRNRSKAKHPKPTLS